MKLENVFPRAASVIAVTSLVSRSASRKRGTGAHSLVSLLIISAVPTPQFGWQPQESEPRERRNKRNGEPVARRFNFANLITDVFRQVRKRVALPQTPLRSDVLV